MVSHMFLLYKKAMQVLATIYFLLWQEKNFPRKMEEERMILM